jgi:hypothetical protein
MRNDIKIGVVFGYQINMFSYWNHLWNIVNQIKNIFSYWRRYYWNHLWRIINQVEKKKEEKLNVSECNNYVSNEDSLSKFAKLIEAHIENLDSDKTYANITRHTYLEIDGMQVDVYIKKEKYKDTYTYHINFQHFISNDEEQSDRSIYSYRKDGCKNVLSILEDIEEIKTYYKFLEQELLSPQKMKYAKMQRTFFPIPPEKNCSVCYETTHQYTVCKHPICFRCRYTCIQKNNLMCPICREEELKIFPSELE